MKVLRKIIEIDEERCDGCGLCVPSCAEGALQIIDGKAKVVLDKFCDGLGACLGECPNNALKVTEREAEEFDEKAVHEHLVNKPKSPDVHLSQGVCPSARIQIFAPEEPCPCASQPVSRQAEGESSLSHWPVKIRLIPAKAPFLKGSNILVMADCVPAAFPTLHQDFLKGKAVLMGCPKFDDKEEYIKKFAEIFKTAGIKHITNIYMEVPCCSALPIIVKKGMEAAGVNIPMENVVISTRGKILKG